MRNIIQTAVHQHAYGMVHMAMSHSPIVHSLCIVRTLKQHPSTLNSNRKVSVLSSWIVIIHEV